MSLQELRSHYRLSQAQAASEIGIPLRTYIRYERDERYGDPLKREMFKKILQDHYETTETKGILTIEEIRESLRSLFDLEYPNQIEFCYLFGSYAKGYAKESSDVDLCVSTTLTGFQFAGLSERIRQTIHKRVDLIRFANLGDNIEMIHEIMKEGVRIYG